MRIAFSQFCSSSPEVQAVLRRRIDTLADRGQSYEFPDYSRPGLSALLASRHRLPGAELGAGRPLRPERLALRQL